MEHIEKVASLGIGRLFDYGAAMVVLVLVTLAMAWTIRYLLNRCDERFEESLRRHEATSTRVTEVLDRNTTTYAQAVVIMDDVKRTLQNINLNNRR